MPSRLFLQRVVHRDVRTHYTISEVLECGHRFESLMLLSDSLVAKHRICEKCAQAAALPAKKSPASVTSFPVAQREGKVSGG